MAIVKVKNAELFNQWIDFLIREQGLEFSTPQIRTEAYFNSQKGLKVPLFQ